MTLVSPGVEVKVIDESFYTPSVAGTIPMIFVATASNKTSSNGTGLASGTIAANIGKPYLLTSQRELGELFGDPLFYSDANNNMIHGSELNEYGLQAAYSALGVTNRVFVARADIDLSKLEPKNAIPTGSPIDGAYWFDTNLTNFGLLEWDAGPVTSPGGQSFSPINPIKITQASSVVDAIGQDYRPKGSIGINGDYAIVAYTTTNQVWYRTHGTNFGAGSPGDWVEVGSAQWKASFPAVRGSTAILGALNSGDSFVVKTDPTSAGVSVVVSGTSVEELVNTFVTACSPLGIYAAYVDGLFEIYSTGPDVYITNGSGSVLTTIGIAESPIDPLTGNPINPYRAPRLEISPHTQVPEFKSTDVTPAPTGSIWLKTTAPNGGANIYVKQYNENSQSWEVPVALIYANHQEAIFNLDVAGGGKNIEVGTLYVKPNIEESISPIANYKIYTRAVTGPTVITSNKITTGTLTPDNYDFTIQESMPGELDLSNPVTIMFDATGIGSDAEALADAINSSSLKHIEASIDSQNRVTIEHKTGGEIRISDNEGVLVKVGFVPGKTPNLYETPMDDSTNQFVASNWKPLSYTPGNAEPGSITPDNEIWYNPIVDEVDIMVHDGNHWRGYREIFPDTDPAGPIVAASQPTTFADGTLPLSGMPDNQLWIDTSEIETYPNIYRFNAVLQQWILINSTDQTTENGIVFADARWGESGSDSSPADINVLNLSSFVDFDAPNPSLYPKGMLLWNLRRSGFNVKRFVHNYINIHEVNKRYEYINPISGKIENQSMEDYYPHRWVTESQNNEDGSGSFGRNAQRKAVVQKLQALVNSNIEIRNEELRPYNLIACPGYPELIGEMVNLNYDRRATAFVIGDTPSRLAPSATTLLEWAGNAKNAPEDNDNGAVSFDEYLGMYYGWGYTSDNAGNNIVVPPSHMALRTIILNDQVAYPWFAPAGTRRGGVSNATTSGYINSEGEFVSTALNTGQRDTLYLNQINPITYINGAGLVVFGQKTRARASSALDRVNVARLIVYLRNQFDILGKPYLFEPNDKVTRDQIKATADALLLELVSLRAIYDFITVCDESNNTPARIDRNELWLDIAIEPVKTIEFIYIPLRIKNTGEIASLG